ncbi:STAS domain-containing protein [Streptomyces sp. NPDC005955]|uniref:STAS domain-containing protein n=1 Tax=Streptomyces sp. NPDC005955 TaxID=3364738 RepID=UPI0036ACB79A
MDVNSPAVLVLPAEVVRGEVILLCEDVRQRLAATGSGRVVCDAGALVAPGLAAVDLLARLQLTARRAGGRIVVRDPPPALRELIRLVGLPLQVEREVEQREPPGRVEEVGDLHDPTV